MFLHSYYKREGISFKNTIGNPKLNFLTIICGIRKKVRIQNCLFQLDLQSLPDIVSDKTYIFYFNFKKRY